MNAPASGSVYTSSFTMANQQAGTSIAATCQAIDGSGAVSSFGTADAYPVCGTCTPPTFSVTASPSRAGNEDVTITVTASEALQSGDPTVRVYKNVISLH